MMHSEAYEFEQQRFWQPVFDIPEAQVRHYEVRILRIDYALHEVGPDADSDQG